MKPRIANINFGKENDISRQKVYAIAQGSQGRIASVYGVSTPEIQVNSTIEIDQEVINLVNWLAEQQGISPERALKKAVLLAAYIQDITANQGGKLLVQRKDNSLGEIILK